ncbi:MAG: hypothetical protein SVU32_00090 [Candidatus Nanohaloarchaea archaeon]|nr:hypothetical protein [Candidatus Nanohaloarchaea archaeon]
MQYRTLAVLVLIAAAVPAATAAQGEGTTTIQVDVGGRVQISPTITNPLSKRDNITLEFKGRAITEGLISWEVAETERVSCSQYLGQCNVTVPAQSSVEFFVNLDGTAYGQGPLVLEGTSELTGMSGKDRAVISVNPRSSGDQKSAPGTTLPYLVLVAGIAAFVATRVRNSL